jgi:hypothetical protein
MCLAWLQKDISMKNLVFSAALAGALLSAGAAQAAVITFAGLPGSNGSAFSGPYVEDGFSIVKTAGDVFEGHSFGNPAPSLVVGSVFEGGTGGALSLTKVGGGAFTLTSFDFTSFGGVGSWSIAGSLNGSGVYALNGGGNFGAAWQTIAGNAAGVDTLVFSLNAEGTSLNLDNIALGDVGRVPEPASWAMMIIGFGLVGAASRRRMAAVTA